MNRSPGINTCDYIILHHTATWEGTLKWVIRWLTVGKASCHYVVDTNGDIYKIWEDRDILRHAGKSEWWSIVGMNKCSIGIEVIGPLSDWWFTQEQYSSVSDLIKYLAWLFAIPEKNVLRHKDIAPWRKVDIYDSFWNKKHKTWDDYRKSLFSTSNTMSKKSKYDDIMKQVLKETWFKQVFIDHEGDEPLMEKEVKQLIEIALARYFSRSKK